ncbi:hypothetical protein [Oceanobacter mangrovi]|uniref:hypothetical protein n=1 Tax=Oceanobacter mangrovi TaxID=2862510 RepID=UPI001C8E0BCE|nr:hypothetical protein [Oceanobacter mangrovi]
MKQLLLIGLLALLSQSTLAAIYKCDVNGSTVFQSLPCEQGNQEVIEKGGYNEFGMHSSWFKRPPYLADTPICSEHGCYCGDVEIKFYQDRSISLFNAMGNIRNSWSTLDSSTQGRSIKSSSYGYKNQSYEKPSPYLQQSACRVAIYQKIILDNYESVANQITQEYEYGLLKQQVNTIINEQKQSTCAKPNLSGWAKVSEAQRWADCIKNNRQSMKLRTSSYVERNFNTLVTESEQLSRHR